MRRIAKSNWRPWSAWRGLDYGVFQLLFERIEKSSGEKQAELMALRENLLEMTYEMDEAIKEQEAPASQALDEIL